MIKRGALALIGIGIIFLVWGSSILMVMDDYDLSETSGFRSLLVILGGILFVFLGIKSSVFQYRWNKLLNKE